MKLERWENEESAVVFDCIKLDVFVPNKIQIFRRYGNNDIHEKILPKIHDDLMFWVCLNGPGAFFLDGVDLLLDSNECFFLIPGQLHNRKYMENSVADWLLVRFSGANQDFFKQYKNLIFKLPPDGQKMLKKIIKKYTEAKTDSVGINKKLFLLEFAKLLAKIPTYIVKTNFNDNSDIKIDKLINDPIWNLSGLESIEDAADKIGVSVKYLRTLYKKTTGKTPMQVRQIMRICSATHLLSHSEEKIQNIANKLGFKSVYAFSRFFKKEVGLSPSAYRNLNKNYSYKQN